LPAKPRDPREEQAPRREMETKLNGDLWSLNIPFHFRSEKLEFLEPLAPFSSCLSFPVKEEKKKRERGARRRIP
jgi:hypothetical protein